MFNTIMAFKQNRFAGCTCHTSSGRGGEGQLDLRNSLSSRGMVGDAGEASGSASAVLLMKALTVLSVTHRGSPSAGRGNTSVRIFGVFRGRLFKQGVPWACRFKSNAITQRKLNRTVYKYAYVIESARAC